MNLRALIWLLSLSMLSACASTGEVDEAPSGIVPTAVTFPTTDGATIHALDYAHGPRAVVLAHGGRFNKESWSDEAQTIARAGFRVLAIDFRGYGESTGGTSSEEVGYALDILGAVRYLRETGARQVSVVGASFGGWAAGNASALAPVGAIDAIVLLAHSPVDRPDRLKGRKLFIVAQNDLNFDGSPRLLAIQEQYQRAPQPKELVILPGDAHAQFIFDTDQGDALMDAILRFLREN